MTSKDSTHVAFFPSFVCVPSIESTEQAKRVHQRASNRLSRIEEALVTAKSELEEQTQRLPVTEKAIEAAQTALVEAQTAIPPLRDAAESQQRKVLAIAQVNRWGMR